MIASVKRLISATCQDGVTPIGVVVQSTDTYTSCNARRKKKCFFPAVHCNIHIRYKPTKVTCSELIFYFKILIFDVFYIYRTHTSVYKTVILMHVQHAIPCLIFIYIPEDKPWGTKHVEDIKK